MKLVPINLKEDNKQQLFASADCQDLLKMYEAYYPKIGFHPPWIGYFVMKENEVVGSCGFTGRPQNGKVEIAYWTFEDFEGQGIATFSCQQLIDIALNADPTLIITAKTAPEHGASTKILEKNGFEFSGNVIDDEIGNAWEWTLKRNDK